VTSDALFASLRTLWDGQLWPFIRETFIPQTANYVGRMQDENPEAYRVLRPLYDAVLNNITTWQRAWKQVEAGGAATADGAMLQDMLSQGEALLVQLKNCAAAVRAGTPGPLITGLKAARDITVHVVTRVTEGIASVGERVIGAGDFLSKNLAFIALGLGALWLLGPAIIKAVAGGKRG